MRNIANKFMTGSMVVAAALLVSACGRSETANSADTNMTDMNTMESDMGTTNDMTAVDGAMGADANMAMDNMSGNMMDSNMSMDNMSTNMSNGM